MKVQKSRAFTKWDQPVRFNNGLTLNDHRYPLSPPSVVTYWVPQLLAMGLVSTTFVRQGEEDGRWNYEDIYTFPSLHLRMDKWLSY